MLDIVFINPGDRKVIFQDLGKDITAIEPPYLTLSFATYLETKGFSVKIIDANAENISPEETLERIKVLNPSLIALMVYGSQPSASTQNMTIAGKVATTIKKDCNIPIVMGGLHPSALPNKTLQEESVDFVIEGEEQIPLEQLLIQLKTNQDFSKVEGLWYYDNNIIKNNTKGKLIENLDEVMPIANWDLLSMEKYRAHNWHCFDDIENRSPYAAIYTSLGCPYKCTFCCINAPFGKSTIRYRSPKIIVDELEILQKKYGIKNIKFIDEMFVLNESHYMTIVDLIIERNLDFNIWCYARVDTVNPTTLEKIKKAGINWLALGIESADPNVRDGASKKMRVKDIKQRVKLIQNAGIHVIGNYIFGLRDDTKESMQETLTMAKELNCEFANFYCAMAYPGSPLYTISLNEKLKLPEQWTGYSQHSYDIQPLPSKYLSAKEILEFRDNAFHNYFEDKRYLNMLELKFGSEVKKYMREITKTKLQRRILE
ncbi:B12-binding domain-containing radical SAM protein [Aliarcobacter cryaerophilus]|uniref:B12-binding domain-containing radical SAM protein n=1 Tax=Aliarcobacter cryaerophilus TaxID=28198 RepID=UPI0021B52325|nr:radical SAM protein [Aliarcobacter cryaerophilus]MCT7516355.1 B12-binding domain-containing radical SAM protein [Aliarcobacter cryaerophilus]